MSIKWVMLSNHLILCHPLLLLSSISATSESFPMSQLFESGGQSIGASSSASVLPMSIQDWFPLGLTGWISLQSKGLWRIFSNTTVQKHHFFSTQLSLWSNSHIYAWLLEKKIVLTTRTFVDKVMCLLFNMLSGLVIAFLPRSKRLLISWLQSPSAVILKPKKIKSVTVSIVSPSICYEVTGLDIYNASHCWARWWCAVLCLVAQSYTALCNPMDCSLPASSVLEDSPGKHTGVGCHALLQGIFPTQGSNPGLLHCRQILYLLSHQGSPKILEWVAYPFSRGSSRPRNWTKVSCIANGFFTSWATREAQMVMTMMIFGDPLKMTLECKNRCHVLDNCNSFFSMW